MIRKITSKDYPIIKKYYKLFNFSFTPDYDPFKKVFVYELDSNVVGFIDYSIIYERVELNYIYVNEGYRNKKIASKLMNWMIDDAISSGCENITLEVSISNLKAINLYEKNGFIKQAIRPNYYQASDGILMMKKLEK